MPNSETTSKNAILITQTQGAVAGDGEANWNRGTLKRYYSFSVKTGLRKEIKVLNNFRGRVFLSRNGKFVIYYDSKSKNYFSYEISSEKVRNITKDLKTEWTPKSMREEVNGVGGVSEPILWIGDDDFVLLYDCNDVWRIDPRAFLPAINLTNGYGRRNNCSFEVALNYSDVNIKENDSILLTVFNYSNKQNGFCHIKLNQVQRPVLLGSGDFYYCGSNIAMSPLNHETSTRLLKARDAEVYVVQRQKVDEFPNLFTTINFQEYNRLTNLQPEKKYNWFRSELHTWTSLDGKKLQGILFMPENFNPQEKYPVIFYYYEKMSDGLNLYIAPKLSTGSLNIAWYVSNGYLVFTPDIFYKIGDPGQSAYNAILSAAKYLKRLPFVNGEKMGIQGFSFGGFETNYLVTHSKIFAAACSGAGCSDVISAYGIGSGGYKLETGQYRIGRSLWENKEAYLKNSAVLNAERITTPLLLIHNTVDGAVPFTQGVEFFTALRRLGKKAWLLEYEDGNHGVDGKSAQDFTLRMAQFFNHYLKGQPAPKWMTRSVTPAMKIAGDDLQMDQDIKTPGPGILIHK